MKRFVTSMSPEIWQQYGQVFLDSFLKFWPSDYPLNIYFDGKPPMADTDRVQWFNLYEIPGVNRFLSMVGQFPVFRGLVLNNYHYNLDLYRFCRKHFALMHASDRDRYHGLLYWVDADVETIAPVPEEWLDTWLQDTCVCVMKRTEYHLCASFVGINCSHPQAQFFWREMNNRYALGYVFPMFQWHDSFVLQELLENGKVSHRDIAAQWAQVEKGPWNVFNAVFDGRAVHRKGQLKGRTRYGRMLEEVLKRQPASILEIGTHDGTRALEFHMAAPMATYEGIDLFEQGSEEMDKAELNVKRRTTEAEVREKLQNANLQFALYTGDSKKVLPELVEQGFKYDFIFIDGGHSVETIQNDLMHSISLLLPGGCIVMDDYYTGVDFEFLSKFGCNLVIKGLKHELFKEIDPTVHGGGVTMALIEYDAVGVTA